MADGLAVVADAPVVVETVIEDGPDIPISKSKYGLVDEMPLDEVNEDGEEEEGEGEGEATEEVEQTVVEPQHKEHEVKIAEPEPQQFAEAKSEHAGEYIKRTRSTHSSKMQLSLSKTGSKMHISPSKMVASPSRMHMSPSQAAVSKSKMKLAPKISVTPSKPEIRTSVPGATGEVPRDSAKSVESASRPDLVGRSLSKSDERRASRMRSLTSQDRLTTMSEEGGGIARRKYSERRSSSRAHGTLTGSIISFRRTSAEVDRAKIPRMQNTYRMESKRPFNSDCVSIILREVIEKECEHERYDALKSPRFAMALTSEIRSRIKLQHFDRYKIVVYVNVCEKQQQSLHSVMRFLWDAEKDNYSTYTFENTTMFVVATAFGVYYE